MLRLLITLLVITATIPYTTCSDLIIKSTNSESGFSGAVRSAGRVRLHSHAVFGDSFVVVDNEAAVHTFRRDSNPSGQISDDILLDHGSDDPFAFLDLDLDVSDVREVEKMEKESMNLNIVNGDANPYLVASKAVTGKELEDVCGDKALYMGDSAFVVRCTPVQARKVEDLPGVSWISPYLPRFRVSRPLVTTLSQRLSQSTSSNTALPVLYVLLHPTERTREEAQIIASNLVKKIDFNVEAEAVSSEKIVIRTKSTADTEGVEATKSEQSQNHMQMVKIIASDPDVHFIEEKTIFKPLNRYSHGLIQSGDVLSSPFWDLGLHGEDEVIGCGDTGVDWDLCYFKDSNAAMPFDTISSTHRKFTTYRTWGDTFDYNGGHGTHVCGSLAGDWKPVSTYDDSVQRQFNGMAPAAKLAFGDICSGYCYSELKLPDDLNTGFFSVLHGAGARIHSNSWGGASVYYTSSGRESDQYAWNNRDALPLFAAGNSGTQGFYSIDSPGHAKNVVAVGASVQAASAYREDGTATLIVISGPKVSGSGSQLQLHVAPATFGFRFVDTDMSAPLYDIGLACDNATVLALAPKNRGEWICYAQRGTCAFVDKAYLCQMAGGKGFILSNNVDGIIKMGGTDARITIPCASMSKADGSIVAAAMAQPTPIPPPPSPTVTVSPSSVPTVSPSSVPSATVSATMTMIPTAILTSTAVASPSASPSSPPSFSPSAIPSASPTTLPSSSAIPTSSPSAIPSASPTTLPSSSAIPTSSPSAIPSASPTTLPSSSAIPTSSPSAIPSTTPTTLPSSSAIPTSSPSAIPSASPTTLPSSSAIPTSSPSAIPSASPTSAPSSTTTASPSTSPTNTTAPEGSYQYEYAITTIPQSILNVTISQQVFSLNPKQNQDCMASFSSRGPTYDLRFKPEVVSPGDAVLSAWSDGDSSSNACPMRQLKMMGTSMATPILAGNTALLRQYFRKGYYYDGADGCSTTADDNLGFAPKGALLKALLITSAVRMTGYLNKDGGGDYHLLAGDSLPSPYVGWGRVNMAHILPMPRPTTSIGFVCPSLFVRPNITGVSPSLSTGESHAYCVKLNSAPGFQRDFIATVTWTDIPGAVGGFHMLVNDLDLTVMEIGAGPVPSNNYTKFWVGNGRQGADQPSTVCGARRSRDRDNNVERVHVPIADQPGNGKMVVVVRGSNVPQGPQTYAMALSGAFTVLPESECSALYNDAVGCPNRCSGRGACVGGVCQCNRGLDTAYSADCSQVAPQLSLPSAKQTALLNCDEWMYYVVPVNVNQALPRIITVTMTSTSGDPDLYVRKDDFPDLTTYTASDSHCDTCTNPQQPTPRPVSTVTFSVPGHDKATPQIEYYYIGVYGYASIWTPTGYSLEVTYSNETYVFSPSPTPSPSPSPTSLSSYSPTPTPNSNPTTKPDSQPTQGSTTNGGDHVFGTEEWERLALAGGIVGGIVAVALIVWLATLFAPEIKMGQRGGRTHGFTTLPDETDFEGVIELENRNGNEEGEGRREDGGVSIEIVEEEEDGEAYRQNTRIPALPPNTTDANGTSTTSVQRKDIRTEVEEGIEEEERERDEVSISHPTESD